MQVNQTLPTQNKLYSGYWILIALAVLFIGPLVAAWSFYESGNHWVASKVNYGQFIKPVQPISAVPLTTLKHQRFLTENLKGKWNVFFFESKKCRQACEHTLYNIRQARLALGEDMIRVQRFLVTSANIKQPKKLTQLLAQEYDGTQHLLLGKTHPNKLAKLLATSKQQLAQGQVYIVDPLGNLILRYPAAVKPKAIFSDLKRLLKVSALG